MTFNSFKSAVQRFMAKAGMTGGVTFYQADGKHIAKFVSGEMITGNTLSKKLTVRYGSGHQMMVAI